MKFSQIRVALAWLESKELDQINWFQIMPCVNDVLSLKVYGTELTSVERRNLKQHFGPLEIVSTYEAKDELGEVRLSSDGMVIKLRITGAYACTKKDAKTMTEKDWDAFKEKARRGLIDVVNCEAVDLKEETG